MYKEFAKTIKALLVITDTNKQKTVCCLGFNKLLFTNKEISIQI